MGWLQYPSIRSTVIFSGRIEFPSAEGQLKFPLKKEADPNGNTSGMSSVFKTVGSPIVLKFLTKIEF
jgi:hypothetical protein